MIACALAQPAQQNVAVAAAAQTLAAMRADARRGRRRRRGEERGVGHLRNIRRVSA